MKRFSLVTGTVLALFALACNSRSDVQLRIRLPGDHRLLTSVSELDLRVERDGRVLAQHSYAAATASVSASGVSHGARTIVTLDGLTASGDVIATGSTCPFDFSGAGESATLYFAPTDFFAPTVGGPLRVRDDPLALALDDGTVVLVGGIDLMSKQAITSAEQFAPSAGRFSAASETLNVAREAPQLAIVPGVGALVVGGLDAQGTPLGSSEVYRTADRTFLSLDNQVLGARANHTAVTLTDGRVFVAGGQSVAAGAPVTTTAFVSVETDGTASVVAGPSLLQARRNHSALVAVGVVVVLGGYGPDGQPTDSIEALLPADQEQPQMFASIATLREARAEATATLLQDGSILIVGGAGDVARTPRADAEVYNPISRTTTLYPLSAPRRAHTATLLPNGRVLVVGGVGSDGSTLSSVELFIPSVGFVSERPLSTARAEHVAVPLCDGTVLVVGGAPGAELYTPPSG